MRDIDEQMSQPTFWNNQERAQAVVEERKSLSAILTPLDNILKSSDDLTAMIEMAAEVGSPGTELEFAL